MELKSCMKVYQKETHRSKVLDETYENAAGLAEIAGITRVADITKLDRIGIPHTVPEGAYYILLDISEYGYASDLAFCEKLAQHIGVGAVPGSSFFKEPENRYIRLHFAKKNETLNEALERLQAIREKMPRA